MRVRFWGVRGSIPSPGPDTVRTGGNTSCIEVEHEGEPVILDAGTGLRPLGEKLLHQGNAGSRRIHLFVTHTHWDHIQGLPFFGPLHRSDRELVIYGPAGLEHGLEETMLLQLQRTYFPIRRSEIRARVQFRELEEGTALETAGLQVRTKWMNHPVLSLGYVLSAGGCSLAYTGDHEPYTFPHVYAPNANQTAKLHLSGEEAERRKEALVGFLRGTGTLISDAQYTDSEYREKTGWGHSPISYAVDLACESEAGALVLFHHDPAARDDVLEEHLQAARTALRGRGFSGKVYLAREGEALDVGPHG